MSSVAAPSTIYLGLDVHKESITIAVLPGEATVPSRIDKLPYDLRKLRRYVERLGPADSIRACYEASGAGYVVHRAFAEWGMACAVIAPSLIPTRPGVQRKHDKYDASQLARLFRAGELTAVHVPTEAEERVRDLVRCRATFQREILKSRHYILKFLARRGFVFREGTNWRQPHYEWLRRLASAKSPLVAEDRVVFGEYLALLEYKLARREERDRSARPHAGARPPGGAVAVLSRDRHARGHGARDGVGRLATLFQCTRADGLLWPRAPRTFKWGTTATRIHHQGG